MSGTVNRVTLIGRLGKDPETKETSNDKKVCKFSLATDETYKDKDGEKVSKTSWHNIVAWGKLAEISEKYLRKGSLVFVEGKIEYRKWQDNEGNEKRATDIVISSMTMLGGKPDSESGGSSAKPETKKKDDWGGSGGSTEDDSEIPF